MSKIRPNPVPRFTYEVGKRYRLYGNWSSFGGCSPGEGEPLLGECTFVSHKTGKGHIARVDEDGRVHPNCRWNFYPDGYAVQSSSVEVPPLAVVLYEVPRKTITIVIDGKTSVIVRGDLFGESERIEIDDDKFQALKKELCQWLCK